MTWVVSVDRHPKGYEIYSVRRARQYRSDRDEAIDVAEKVAQDIHDSDGRPVQVVVEGEPGAFYGEPEPPPSAAADLRAAIVHAKLAAACLDRVPDEGSAAESLSEARRNAHDCASLAADVLVERSGR